MINALLFFQFVQDGKPLAPASVWLALAIEIGITEAAAAAPATVAEPARKFLLLEFILVFFAIIFPLIL